MALGFTTGEDTRSMGDPDSEEEEEEDNRNAVMQYRALFKEHKTFTMPVCGNREEKIEFGFLPRPIDRGLRVHCPLVIADGPQGDGKPNLHATYSPLVSNEVCGRQIPDRTALSINGIQAARQTDWATARR